MKKSISILLVTFLLTSCMTTRTQVGAYRESTGSSCTYGKGHQMWLFWGLIPVGRTNVSTPANGSCEVITWFSFTDMLVSGLTGGIVEL